LNSDEREREREREEKRREENRREEKVVERGVRDAAFYRGIETFPTLKDSKQSPLVLVEEH
jgi:hypothetical protein